jgi:hypothetical protein
MFEMNKVDENAIISLLHNFGLTNHLQPATVHLQPVDQVRPGMTRITRMRTFHVRLSVSEGAS